jgi:hypothetical protein
MEIVNSPMLGLSRSVKSGYQGVLADS